MEVHPWIGNRHGYVGLSLVDAGLVGEIIVCGFLDSFRNAIFCGLVIVEFLMYHCY